MFKHILIPTDGSSGSAKAIKGGVALAKEMGARVTGYHGVGAAPYAYYGETMLLDRRSIAKAERWAGVPFTPLVARTGATYEGILDAARRRKCDVIFMASHGRRGLTGLLLGSVSQQVLAHSKIPVLVYR